MTESTPIVANSYGLQLHLKKISK